MTGGTAKPRLRFWRIDLVPDWAVKLTVELIANFQDV